ncbi:MAG: hypothetical protein ISS94_01465 [Candidatus Syntrophoarchaeum sp.]|nr:hypothetical protein [Methanomicrobia archaeon]MBL7117441.1 hypothetical protein [Candidatus Syntrophoarchaeum sp.]
MDKGIKEVYDGIKKIITITEKIAEHTKDIAEIKEKVAENTGDIAEIKGKAGVIENRLDSMDGRLSSVEERLISLETGQKVISVDIRAIKDKLEVKDEIYAMKERLSAVEAEIGKVKA